MVRLAVLQIERSSDSSESLSRCLAQIDRAVLEHGAQVVLCPELAASAASEDHEVRGSRHELEAALASRARARSLWIAASIRDAARSQQTWFSPEGVAASVDDAELSIAETPFGKIGLCPSERVYQAAPVRALALEGVGLVCASLGVASEARSALHLPARAAENGVFVAAAALFEPVPEPYPAAFATLPPDAPGAAIHVRGATCQIFDPHGHSLATAVSDASGIAIATLELDLVERDDDAPLARRRPELYRVHSTRARAKTSSSIGVASLDLPCAADPLEVAMLTASHVRTLAADGIKLIVLPELFCFADLALEAPDAQAAADTFLSVVRLLAEACRGSAAHVVTSLVERVNADLTHVGVLIGQGGIVARQVQLHVPRRFDWARPGRRVESVRLPWGTLGIAVGDDARMPELARVYGALGVDLVAAPLSARYQSETVLTLPALADEYRFGVVAALRTEAGPEHRKASFIVDPGHWPALTGLAGQHVLEGRLAVADLRSASLEQRRQRPREIVSIQET